jgi:HPt (histidine-containing phosphotransfer) domain-containing protein
MNFQSNNNMLAYSLHSSSRSRLYDLAELQKLSLGNEEFVPKMVTIFLQQTPLLLKHIKEALDAKDLDRISIYSYKIKTSIDTLGIYSLVETVRKLEKVRLYQIEYREICHLVSNLEEGLDLVIGELNRDFLK